MNIWVKISANIIPAIFCIYCLASQAHASGALLSLKQENWTVLSYKKIPANSVSFSEGRLSVNVASSAGPIVYKLEPILDVTGFTVKGSLSGTKKVETGTFDEDSALRIGLVATGKQTLTGPKKWFAADWVKKLFSLAPPGLGLDKIYFHNITNRSDLLGKTRAHPKSDLMVETVFANQQSEGPFEFSKKLDLPVKTAAVWISIDGDDTQSEFKVSITEIKLLNAP